MTYFMRPTSSLDNGTHTFYNLDQETAHSNDSMTSCSLNLLNSEWIGLILMVFVCLNTKDLFAGSEKSTLNTLILVFLAYVLLSQTTCHK